ncbi:hypothetical protein LCGC14_2407190, partial [marine sediment metagenome]
YYQPRTGGGRTTTQEPYPTSPYEELDTLREQFQELPVTYKTDPVTGKVIASKSMPKTPRPASIGPFSDYAQYYKSNLLDEEPLNFNWVLPKGALTGPKFQQYNPPPSDVARQAAYNLGISGVGDRRAMLNPQTFWPESAFDVPIRQASGFPHSKPTPVFGGTIDYTTGKRYTPGGRLSDPYGTFDPRRKTPPMIGAKVFERTQPLTSQQTIRKKRSRRTDLLYSRFGMT